MLFIASIISELSSLTIVRLCNQFAVGNALLQGPLQPQNGCNINFRKKNNVKWGLRAKSFPQKAKQIKLSN